MSSIGDALMILAVSVAVFLFSGEPDVHDALLQKWSQCPQPSDTKAAE